MDRETMPIMKWSICGQCKNYNYESLPAYDSVYEDMHIECSAGICIYCKLKRKTPCSYFEKKEEERIG